MQIILYKTEVYVPCVFGPVVVGDLPEEFVCQSSGRLCQPALQILTVQSDHVKMLNTRQSHYFRCQVSVLVNLLKQIYHDFIQNTWMRKEFAFVPWLSLDHRLFRHFYIGLDLFQMNKFEVFTSTGFQNINKCNNFWKHCCEIMFPTNSKDIMNRTKIRIVSSIVDNKDTAEVSIVHSKAKGSV